MSWLINLIIVYVTLLLRLFLHDAAATAVLCVYTNAKETTNGAALKTAQICLRTLMMLGLCSIPLNVVDDSMSERNLSIAGPHLSTITRCNNLTVDINLHRL